MEEIRKKLEEIKTEREQTKESGREKKRAVALPYAISFLVKACPCNR